MPIRPLRTATTTATILLALGALSCPVHAQADDAGLPADDGAPEITWRWSAGGSHLFDADIDDGGSFSLDRVRTGIGAALELDPNLRLDVSVSYEYDAYDFSGSTGFGGLDPWGDVQGLSASARLTYIVDRTWALFGGPIVGMAAEDGADLGDGFYGGGIFGANYRASDVLSIGFGVGVISRIEDDPIFIPALTLDWRPADGVAVRAGALDLGSSGGPGAEVTWDMTDDWTLSVGAQFNRRRFRLDDRGIAPDGVGDETAFPVYVRSRWTIGGGSTVELFGGFVAGGELLLENDRGNRISEQDYDPAPIVGARVRIRF